MAYRILVVEDDTILAKVIREELEEAGFSTDMSGDGSLSAADIRKMNPDLVLLDLLLPGRHGFEILEDIKKSPETKAIPVIILTQLGSDDDIKKGFELGANDYIVKSQHPVAEIVEKITQFFAREPRSGAEHKQ
ncbi:MAG: response regulator [Parcubacteria group bacterium]|nr:response regulator [Parcubacteria group bacterium]